MSKRIAMWSGPRNISTAMMRSWENRQDTCVVDEPFYAVYLAQTGLKHPCYEDILEHMPTHFDDVVSELTASVMEHDVFYQKHMTHHMLPDADMSWAVALQHCFLIRDPEEVVVSYAKKMDTCSATDIGIIRQAELYDEISDLTGQDIPIIDSNDVLANPEGMLSALCDVLDISFSERMLQWPAGKRESDGVWAPHWYANVDASTGFSPYSPTVASLTEEQQQVVEEVRPYYQRLHANRLTVD